MNRTSKSILPTTATRFFTRFVADANIRNLHALDWKRFYEFVAVCHRTRVRAGYEDIAQMLRAAGFDKTDIASLTSVYDHGRRLLRAIPGAAAQMSRDRLARSQVITAPVSSNAQLPATSNQPSER